MNRLSKNNPHILLVNPWIHDFAAYDLWMKPVGLLGIGAILRENGYSVDLIDCLDRYDPVIPESERGKPGAFFTGKYTKRPIPKPPAVQDVNRYYAQYGTPERFVHAKLRDIRTPDAVFVTSAMTYWYGGVAETIRVLRERFPDVPVVLGGIYATLMPAHAEEFSGADYIFTGEAEQQILDWLHETFGFPGGRKYRTLDEYPHPAYDLYNAVHFLPLLSSRGCPLNCTFCASRLLSGGYRRRSVESVLNEIFISADRFGVDTVAFYDDALLHEKERHFQPVVQEILESGRRLTLHTPNGLQAEAIDKETARLMFRAEFRTVRLSLETVDPAQRRNISHKVTAGGFAGAVANLSDAGYDRKEIETYILMGLPRQTPADVLDTVWFAAETGVISRLAAFSPIPGTPDYEEAIKCGELRKGADPLEMNNTVFILRHPGFGVEQVQKLKRIANTLNDCIRRGMTLPDKRALTAMLKDADSGPRITGMNN